MSYDEVAVVDRPRLRYLVPTMRRLVFALNNTTGRIF